MGRDVTIYTENADNKKLKDFLVSCDFHKVNAKLKNQSKEYFYFWFEEKDYKSITGVEATIYLPKKGEYKENGWAIHLRNTYSASYFDTEKMISVLKLARKTFRCTIRGDYGTNKYPPLNEYESTPISRGLSFIFQSCESRIRAIIFTLPEPIIKLDNNENPNLDFLNMIKQQDPIRVLYSSLIPFAISALEFFFSQTFQILLKYDSKAKNKIKEYNHKIQLSDVLKILENEFSVEGEIANKYSFQNLDQINKAFKEWFDVDIRKILYKRKKIGNSIKLLEKRISEIIEFRHKVIHHMAIDTTLEKEEVINIFNTIKVIMDLITDNLEKKYNTKIERF